jgi:hypothetical protein
MKGHPCGWPLRRLAGLGARRSPIRGMGALPSRRTIPHSDYLSSTRLRQVAGVPLFIGQRREAALAAAWRSTRRFQDDDITDCSRCRRSRGQGLGGALQRDNATCSRGARANRFMRGRRRYQTRSSAGLSRLSEQFQAGCAIRVVGPANDTLDISRPALSRCSVSQSSAATRDANSAWTRQIVERHATSRATGRAPSSSICRLLCSVSSACCLALARAWSMGSDSYRPCNLPSRLLRVGSRTASAGASVAMRIRGHRAKRER